MWKEGTIGINGKVARFWVKHYEEGSVFGIDNGRISKLMVKIDGEIVLNYDRGWDVDPTTEEAKIALAILMKDYN